MSKVSCIYCIKHKLDTEWSNIYIGSTKNLRSREISHKSNCNNETKYNMKIYKYIRKNGGMDNFEFIILEECEVEKLKRLEQSYMDVYKPSLNNYYAYGVDIERNRETQKEKYERDIDTYKINNAEYYQKNKNHLIQKARDYREINKEDIRKREKIRNDKRRDHLNEKFNCECGGKYTRTTTARHKKSKMHQAYITQSSQNSH